MSTSIRIEQHAPTALVVPRLTQSVVNDVRVVDRHPLIQLDRLSIPGNQEAQKRALEQVIQTSGDNKLLTEVAERRRRLLTSTSSTCTQWTMTTSGPLTLHLSRANALENAGLAMHPVYGFAYLPASGLKGMARAAASNLLGLSSERIIEIFGNESGEAREGMQRAGSVCFHDAWPIGWPKLFIDIMTNHHPDYYSGEDAPGDWESPNPVYFLAVESKTAFEFLVTSRRQDCDLTVIDDAKRCLHAALCGAGAGAKTAAGYGWFVPIDNLGPDKQTGLERLLKWTVRLTSPAFLAGASQNQTDCDLRSATLRGQLRAWWRTMHSGFCDRDQLRQLEAAVWGDTVQGSSVHLNLVTLAKPTVRLHEHPGGRDSGLRYLAYGMDETSRGQRKQRCIADMDGRWELFARFEKSKYSAPQPLLRERKVDQKRIEGISIPQELIQEQFQSALWLFGQFGSVGSKGRKGFGSLRFEGNTSFHTIDQVIAVASRLRTHLGLPNEFLLNRVESGAISHPGMVHGEVGVNAADARGAIDKLGQAYMAVASSYKHEAIKAGLGLPRKIHGPKSEPMGHQNAASHRRPKPLDSRRCKQKRVEDARYSSPLHLHVESNGAGQWILRWIALPAVDLPSLDENAKFLGDFTNKLKSELVAKAQVGPANTPARAASPKSVQGFELVTVTVLTVNQVGNRFQCKVQEEGKPKPGMLVDGTPPATPPAIESTLTVYRSSTSDLNSPRYRWTLPPVQPPPFRKKK